MDFHHKWQRELSSTVGEIFKMDFFSLKRSLAKFTWEDFENKPLGNFQTSSGKTLIWGLSRFLSILEWL